VTARTPDNLTVTTHAGAYSPLGFVVGSDGVVGGAMLEAALPVVERDATYSAWGKLWAAGIEGGADSGLNAPLKPYEQSLWTYRCVSAIQRSAKGIPVRLSREPAGVKVHVRRGYGLAVDRRSAALRRWPGTRTVCTRAIGGDDAVVESGPAFDLLAQPNSYQDWPALMESTVGWLMLSGSVAWVLADLIGRRPGSIHAVDGRHVSPVWLDGDNGTRELIGYTWRSPRTGREVPLAPDEVKYWALWSAGEDPLKGMGPGLPGRLAVATDYNASLYNASMLVNGAEPGLTITFPGTLTGEQREDYRASLIARYRGAAKAKRELILENGATAAPFGTSMADLQFDQGKRTTRLEICCLYGVPPVVAGWVDAAGDSSAYTANALRQFYQETLFPLLDGFTRGIQELASRFDPRLVVWWDVEDQPVVQDMRTSRLDAAGKYFAMGYPPNWINALLDLGMPDTAWGEAGLLPAGLLPAADVIAGATAPPNFPEGLPGAPGEEPPAEEPPEEPPAAPDDGETTESVERAVADAARERSWKRWMESWRPLLRATEAMLRVRFVRVETAVKRAIARNVQDTTGAEGKGVTRDDSVVGRILAEVFTSDETRAFIARLRVALVDGEELGLRQALVEAGLSGEQLEATLQRLLSHPRIEQILTRRAWAHSARITGTVRHHLRNQLAEGLANGEDVRHLATRVQSVMGNRRKEAVSMASNAVGETLSAARHEGHQAAGMTHKGWLHSRGPGKRRPLHIQAERRYMAHPIPLDEPFVLGAARLMFPRDHAARRPEETYNCQCVQIAMRQRTGGKADAPPAPPASWCTYDEMLLARRERETRAADPAKGQETDHATA